MMQPNARVYFLEMLLKRGEPEAMAAPNMMYTRHMNSAKYLTTDCIGFKVKLLPKQEFVLFYSASLNQTGSV